MLAVICFTWDGTLSGAEPMGVFPCGAHIDAGKLALSPMDIQELLASQNLTLGDVVMMRVYVGGIRRKAARQTLAE